MHFFVVFSRFATLKTNINDAYTNIVKFDTAVSTASNIMNNRIKETKSYPYKTDIISLREKFLFSK